MLYGLCLQTIAICLKSIFYKIWPKSRLLYIQSRLPFSWSRLLQSERRPSREQLMQSRPSSIDVFRRVDSSIREVDSCITRVDSYFKQESTPVLEKSTLGSNGRIFPSRYRSVGSSSINIKVRFLEKANAQSRSIILKHFQALKHSFQSNPRLKLKDTSIGAQGKGEEDILSKLVKIVSLYLHICLVYCSYIGIHFSPSVLDIGLIICIYCGL